MSSVVAGTLVVVALAAPAPAALAVATLLPPSGPDGPDASVPDCSPATTAKATRSTSTSSRATHWQQQQRQPTGSAGCWLRGLRDGGRVLHRAGRARRQRPGRRNASSRCWGGGRGVVQGSVHCKGKITSSSIQGN